MVKRPKRRDTGLVSCDDNTDCAPAALGVDAGNCTITELLSCYPDQMTLMGTVDTSDPIVVSADCIAPSPNNAAANLVAGYPGPGVRTEQIATEFRCVGDSGADYPSCP